MRWLAALVLMLGPAFADGERAGSFDYYLLSLSWSPGWCATTGDAQGSEECAAGRRLGWVLHGLWPQRETGYPAYCTGAGRDPGRAQTEAMRDIMGTGGAARHQWKKHGRCTGLDGVAYLALARRAFGAVVIPPAFRDLDHDISLTADTIEQAFAQANPGFGHGMMAVTCDGGRIADIRLCLTRDLQPRACGPDVATDCSLGAALMEAVR